LFLGGLLDVTGEVVVAGLPDLATPAPG